MIAWCLGEWKKQAGWGENEAGTWENAFVSVFNVFVCLAFSPKAAHSHCWGTGEIPMENMWSSRYEKSEDRVWETTGVDSAGYS